MTHLFYHTKFSEKQLIPKRINKNFAVLRNFRSIRFVYTCAEVWLQNVRERDRKMPKRIGFRGDILQILMRYLISVQYECIFFVTLIFWYLKKSHHERRLACKQVQWLQEEKLGITNTLRPWRQHVVLFNIFKHLWENGWINYTICTIITLYKNRKMIIHNSKKKICSFHCV